MYASARCASWGAGWRARPRSSGRHWRPSVSPASPAWRSHSTRHRGSSPSARSAIAAGWFYTGGTKPYGYLGLGELFVFVFFGLVATVGTTFAAIAEFTALSVVMGCAVGSLACALLVVNNLRDIPTDRDVGKKTLAVRLGDRRTRWLYVVLIVGAFACTALAATWRAPVLLAFVVIPLAVAPVRAVLGGASERELIGVLGATGRLQLAFGAVASLGLLLAS